MISTPTKNKFNKIDQNHLSKIPKCMAVATDMFCTSLSCCNLHEKKCFFFLFVVGNK